MLAKVRKKEISKLNKIGYNIKRYHDSRRSTVTTQTQNKTRQNYYAILPVYAGEAYGATIMDIPIGIKRFRPICTI